MCIPVSFRVKLYREVPAVLAAMHVYLPTNSGEALLIIKFDCLFPLLRFVTTMFVLTERTTDLLLSVHCNVGKGSPL